MGELGIAGAIEHFVERIAVHQRAAILGIEDLGEPVLEAPVVLVGTLEEKSGGVLRGVGEEFLGLLGGFAV